MRRQLGLVVGLLIVPWTAWAQPVRVSVSTAGEQANQASIMPDISQNGRFVVFVTAASNLVAGDTNSDLDVFLRDRDTDDDGVFDEAGAVSTMRISAKPGVQANGASFDPVITPDGRFVVFTSRATSLFSVGQLPLAYTLVFRYDRLNGDLRLVSQNEAGEPANGLCLTPVVSDNGRYVVFLSVATNLTSASAGYSGIYLRDIDAGTTVRLSEPTPMVPNPVPTRDYTFHLVESPTISGDGRLIAFAEVARRLDAEGRAFNSGTITLIDRSTGQVRREFAPGWQVHLARDGNSLVALGAVSEAPGVNGRLYWQHLASGERRIGSVPGGELGAVSPSGRYVQLGGAIFEDFRLRSYLGWFFSNGNVAFSGDDQLIAFRTSHRLLPAGQDSNDAEDIYVNTIARAFDNDSDGLQDFWETFFDLSVYEGNGGGTGDNGPLGDPDGDGVTNAQELAAGTHPRGTFATYLAEGATNAFFGTRIAIANTNAQAAHVLVRFEKSDGTFTWQTVAVPPRQRVSLDASAAYGLGATDFSTVVESDRPVAVDRLMWWDTTTKYGSHGEASRPAPATTWFLAEGATVLDFQLFYLLQNPQATPATATIRFLRPSGSPIVRTYELPPRSRTTIYVNTIPQLESTDVSGEITATQPIVVERAMYRSQGNQIFALGHGAAGVTQATTSWFLAEGATGTFFDTYILIANPSSQSTSVQIDFLRDAGGPLSRTFTVPANSRFTVFADSIPGLEATSFGARITSALPIVVERAMYWPGGFFDYYEGHVSSGVTATGSRWVVAGGEFAGPNFAQTYVLVANTSNATVSAELRLLPEGDGTLTPIAITLLPNTRVTVPVAPPTTRFAVEVVETTSPLSNALVVEGALYWNASGQVWAAGASLPGTRAQP